MQISTVTSHHAGYQPERRHLHGATLIASTAAVEHRSAPLAGEQTEEILREFGYSEEEIHSLEEKNVVRQHA